MRSKQAAKELKKSGYDVVNVRGGMNQWFDRTVGGNKMKIVIVGGVAGGMSAATRLRRLMEDAEIVVLKRTVCFFCKLRLALLSFGRNQ